MPAALLLLLLPALHALAPPPPDYHNGVSMGGWLLTEPSWMYSEFSAPAEGDLITSLRAQGGDTFAVSTMYNHWKGYIPAAALDMMSTFGLTHARIPIPYWILEQPLTPILPAGLANSSTPPRWAYGFQHEGFVTGGMNHLEETLAQLKSRGIKVLIDMHALPGGSSACQSYAGWQVKEPYFWRGTPPPDNTTAISGGCGGGGPYHSSRGSSLTWREVGKQAVLALGAWVVGLQANSSLSDTVVGVEVVNEPGCCVPGWQSDIEGFTAEVVPPLQSVLAAGGVGTNVTINFIGPNNVGVGAWVGEQVKAGAFDPTRLLIDFHQYYNWDGAMSWGQLAAKVCSTNASSSEWSQFTDAGLAVVIGEWSCSTNLGAKAFTDLGDAGVRGHLATLYANQMSLFSARGGGSPGPVGQHHWALRMGSGWDPRPTASAPMGAQVPGTAWDRSAAGFSAAVWNLGELVRVGVARPLAELKVTGVCECNGCSRAGL